MTHALKREKSREAVGRPCATPCDAKGETKKMREKKSATPACRACSCASVRTAKGKDMRVKRVKRQKGKEAVGSRQRAEVPCLGAALCCQRVPSPADENVGLRFPVDVKGMYV